MSGSFVPPGVSQVIAVLQDLVRATYAAGSGGTSPSGNAFQVPFAPTIDDLPAVTARDVGRLQFAGNARNTGQGAGAGTGTLCCVNTSGNWVAVWSGVAPVV